MQLEVDFLIGPQADANYMDAGGNPVEFDKVDYQIS